MEISFTFDRETKGTVRYAEDAPRDAQIVGTLYVRKSAFVGADYPATVTMTLNLAASETVPAQEERPVPFPQTKDAPRSPGEVVPIARPRKTKMVDTSGLPERITPASGYEGMYADFLARVESGTRKMNTGRKRRQRKHESEADYGWRMRHAAEDRFLAHCEVGGLILRRWATDDGDGQIVVFPDTPGSLTAGETRTLMAAEVASLVTRELVAA